MNFIPGWPIGIAIVMYLACIFIGIMLGLMLWRLIGEALAFIVWSRTDAPPPQFGWWDQKGPPSKWALFIVQALILIAVGAYALAAIYNNWLR